VLRIVLWTIAGIVALDVVIAGVFAACAAGYRYRGLRQLRHLEAMWHGEPHHASSYPWAGRRVRRRRVIAPVVLGTVILAGTAMASQGARDVVGSALDNLATHLGIGPDRQVTAVAAPVSEDAAAPLRDHGQPGDPESSNPGAGQRAHAQSQTAPNDPPIGDTTTTDQAGVAPTGGPSMLTATPTSASTIDLAWSNTAGESGYRVERSSQGGAIGWAPVATVGQNVTGFTDSPLSSATTYFYRVIAVRDGVDSVPSAVASATTIIDPPPAPTLTAQAQSTEVVLTWNDVATESGYRIERSVDGGTGWATIGTAGQDVTSFTDAGLTPGTGYGYRVIALNAGGESVPSTPAFTTTTTPDAGTPDAGTPVEPSAS
jgi:Fibronectin type III domain